jgi:hypothetical protein
MCKEMSSQLCNLPAKDYPTPPGFWTFWSIYYKSSKQAQEVLKQDPRYPEFNKLLWFLHHLSLKQSLDPHFSSHSSEISILEKKQQ